HRSRDRARTLAKYLRPVLHHQGGRPGHGARPSHLTPHRRGARRLDRSGERGRGRRGLHCLSVSDQSNGNASGGAGGRGRDHCMSASILIAEDDADLRDLFQDELEDAGYETIVAIDGRAAMAHIEPNLSTPTTCRARSPRRWNRARRNENRRNCGGSRRTHRRASSAFSAHRELFESLSRKQRPETLLITCSDSRIAPELLMQTQPGDLFVLRNAGNLIPPYGAAQGGEGATVEYAITALGVKHALVMGHSNCGAMKGLIHPESLDNMPLVVDWLRHADATRHVVDECYPDLRDDDLLNAAIKENVLVQLDNLRTYPKVAALMAKGSLSLHGWIYE